MAIKGSLREAGLADVCQLLALGQKTGCLSVLDRSRFGQIFFDRGRITFATILNRRDRLGDILVREGILSHDQLAAALDQQRADVDQRLGPLLIERGLVAPRRLEQYVRLQIEEAVHHLLTWTRGSFNFEASRRPGEGEILVSLDTGSVLLESARRTDEWELIRQRITSFDLCFEIAADRLEQAGIELSPDQRILVPLLDGSCSVQDLVERTGLTEFQTGRALSDLIQAGLVQQVGRRAASDAGREPDTAVAEHYNLGLAFYRTGMLDDAARELRSALEVQPRHHGARFQLALVGLRQDQPRDALMQLKLLIDEAGPRAGAFLNLALGLMRLGRYEHALLSIDQAEALRGDLPLAALLRGAILLRLHRLTAAGESFSEYVRRLPPNETPGAPYYHDSAVTHALAGRLREAAALVREGAARHPSAAPLLVLAGAIAERMGDPNDAERWYRRAAEEQPMLPQPHKNLGDLAYDVGALDDALEHYERAVHLKRDLGDDVYARMGNVHYQRNDRERAVRCWEKALQLNPDNHVVRNSLQIVAGALR